MMIVKRGEEIGIVGRVFRSFGKPHFFLLRIPGGLGMEGKGRVEEKRSTRMTPQCGVHKSDFN
jgi:hypothetical protein